MGVEVSDPKSVGQAELEASTLNDGPLNTDGKTAQGNDPLVEMHYPTELDPARAVPENGYPYLDRVQRTESEIRRAAVEGREPDLENPGPDASNPLRSAASLNHPMNVVQAATMAKAEPVAVLDPEDLGLVESEAGNLVPKGTTIGPDSVTENEFGQNVKTGPENADPEAQAELEENNDERDSSDSSGSSSDRSTTSSDSSRTPVKKAVAKKKAQAK